MPRGRNVIIQRVGNQPVVQMPQFSKSALLQAKPSFEVLHSAQSLLYSGIE